MEDIKEIPTEVIHKEIDLIQSCINRMANNSFLLKGWTVSLIAVFIALLSDKVEMFIVFFIISLVITSFWILDAYFLRLEKMYRKLYEWVLIERPKTNYEKLYDLNPNRFSSSVGSIIGIMFSFTLKEGLRCLSLNLLSLNLLSYLNKLSIENHFDKSVGFGFVAIVSKHDNLNLNY